MLETHQEVGEEKVREASFQRAGSNSCCPDQALQESMPDDHSYLHPKAGDPQAMLRDICLPKPTPLPAAATTSYTPPKSRTGRKDNRIGIKGNGFEFNPSPTIHQLLGQIAYHLWTLIPSSVEWV